MQLNLNEENKVSSADIAKVCNKRHDHVKRDIQLKLMNTDFLPDLGETPGVFLETEIVRPKVGRPSEVHWLTIPQAIVILSGYTGEKAQHATKMLVAMADSTMARYEPKYKAQHTNTYRNTPMEIESYKDDPNFAQLFVLRNSTEEIIRTRIDQKKLEARTAAIEDRTATIEDRTAAIEDRTTAIEQRGTVIAEKGIVTAQETAILKKKQADSPMTLSQQENIEVLITKKYNEYHRVGRVCGYIRGDLKLKYFKQPRGHTWKEIPSRYYTEVYEFVVGWEPNAHQWEKISAELQERENNLESGLTF